MTSSAASFAACSNGTAVLTVWYKLVNGTWAEVPISGSTYVGLTIQSNPFTGPVMTPIVPRPYESFSLQFSSSTSTRISRIGFSFAPTATCQSSIRYQRPLFTSGSGLLLSGALALNGTYTLFFGTRTADTTPNITPTQTITFGPCEPCSFSP